MQSRIETAIVLLTLLVTGTGAVLNNLLSIYVAYPFGVVGLWLMWSYSIYWAFSIRRLLSARLYRNQALGIGLVAIVWLTFNLSFLLPGRILPEVSFPLLFLITFYWVDASVLAGRKSDPLFRNTLHWKELRLALWPIMVGAIITLFVLDLVNPSGAIPGQNPSKLSLDVLSILSFVLFVGGTVYLLATATRSKDGILRKHLMWFGLFTASFFGLTLAGGVTGLFIFNILAFIVGTYCIYRSVKSLAPISQLPSEVHVKVS